MDNIPPRYDPNKTEIVMTAKELGIAEPKPVEEAIKNLIDAGSAWAEVRKRQQEKKKQNP